MAHVHGRPDNQDQFLDDILGRGPGDPDVYGYPGEDEAPSPKATIKTKKPSEPSKKE